MDVTTGGHRIRASAASLVPPRAFAALMRAVYPRADAELASASRWVPRGGTAVDIGAWYGPWTARLLSLAERVVTFEPNPVLAALLREGLPRAQIIEAAASDAEGTSTLWLPAGGRGSEGRASLVHQDGEPVRVRTVMVDSLRLTSVRFIKIDVEGHEAAALRGAAETIKRDSPALLVELETRHQEIDAVTGLLAGWGYQGSVLDHGRWVPLDGFDLAAHQRANAHVAARSLAGRLARPRARYINSVLFRR